MYRASKLHAIEHQIRVISRENQDYWREMLSLESLFHPRMYELEMLVSFNNRDMLELEARRTQCLR